MFLENRSANVDTPTSHGAYASMKEWLASAATGTTPVANGASRSGQLAASNPKSNWLLASMPETERQRLLPFLELVEMPLGKVLHESGDCVRHVYFPTSAVVSLLYVMENGASGEVAVVGSDGLVGMALLMGSESTHNRSVVQTAGMGFRLNARIIKSEFHRGGPVLTLLLKYTQTLITQTAQMAMCNRHHSVDQQLCRRLLQSLDLQSGNQIVVTQERIAGMLGVRREGVTAAALRLQESGFISYTRGRISVLDRTGLEKRTCECYAVVKKEYRRLLPVDPKPVNCAAYGASQYRPASQTRHLLNNATV
jgi:CRP-like cAMP-binding protein